SSQSVSRSGQSRFLLVLVIGVIVAMTTLLVSRLFVLQVSSHERYEDLANGNRIRETISYAPRGNIYDREGRLLASNTITFQLSATPYLVERNESDRTADYELIAGLLDIKSEDIAEAVEENGLEYPLPVIVRSYIRHEQALALRQYLPRLSGFHLSDVPTRKYVADAGLAHIIGYTGVVSEADLD